jgi:hypothetical protein
LFLLLDFLCAVDDLAPEALGIGAGDDDAEAHGGALDGEFGVGLEELYAFRDLVAGWERAKWKRNRRNLGLGGFVGFDAEPCFCHGFLDHADGVGPAGCRVEGGLRGEGGDFFAQGGEVVFALFFADLELAFFEDLVIV